jgi:hypothetical protein
MSDLLGLTWTPSREPGARLAVSDLVVIASGIAATGALQASAPLLAWLPPVVFGHFFLFCNVVRLRTAKELAWCAVFLANFALHAHAGAVGGGAILAWQLPVTLALVASEVASPGYRGLGYAALGKNPPRACTHRPKR